VHGATENAIAAGFVCINAAKKYASPDRNKYPIKGEPTWSLHPQPRALEITLAKVKQLPRRSRENEEGYDALGIVVIDLKNDGSPVEVVNSPPAPDTGDIYYYDRMIDRLSHIYATRFRNL
jgi:hypothetical protein